MTHPAEKYLGKPYKTGAEGPDAYDCWGLVVSVQRDIFNRFLPSVTSPPSNVKELVRFVKDHEFRKYLKPSEKPIHGAIVEMGSGSHPFHIGVWLDIDGGGLLHSSNPAGVCFDRMITLKLSGWRGMKFHEWTI